MYRWVDHVAELELQIEAPTEEALFADALVAFAELVDGDTEGGEEPERRELELEGRDRGLLLADWLNELVYLADRDGFVPTRATELELDDARLRAVVDGRRGEPRPLVKAASLHGLEYGQAPETGWRARVVLDV